MIAETDVQMEGLPGVIFNPDRELQSGETVLAKNGNAYYVVIINGKDEAGYYGIWYDLPELGKKYSKCCGRGDSQVVDLSNIVSVLEQGYVLVDSKGIPVANRGGRSSRGYHQFPEVLPYRSCLTAHSLTGRKSSSVSRQ